MTRLLVSFSTRPSQGSEGGVGWSFLKAALELSATDKQPLQLVYDARDDTDIRQGIVGLPGVEHLRLLPVRVPLPLLNRYGSSRNRQTYLGWRVPAKKAVSEACDNERIDVVHQTTFATAVLPSAIPKNLHAKTVWGPLSVPWAPSYAEGRKPKLANRAGVSLGRQLGRMNVSGLGLVVATNELSAGLFSATAESVVIEPNIFVDIEQTPLVDRDPYLLTFAGLLTDLKRPWLAVQALQDPRLKSYRLQIIGDGPLQKSLLSYVNQEGLSDRVLFRGRLPHSEVPMAMASSRALVHPSVREGASWVVGEAAAVGVPSIVFEGVGASTTVKFSNNGGVVCAGHGNLAANLATGVIQACSGPVPAPSDRWSSKRLPSLLKKWWPET